MAAKKATKQQAPKRAAKKAAANGESTAKFTAEERDAIRERARELKAAGRARGGESEEDAVLEKIAAMAATDRAMAERLHAIVKASAPDLTPRLWYGMPAYAKDGNVVCFFQSAGKFKARYATLGFSDKAMLDDGEMWPTSFALNKLTAADEKRIATLLERAVG